MPENEPKETVTLYVLTLGEDAEANSLVFYGPWAQTRQWLATILLKIIGKLSQTQVGEIGQGEQWPSEIEVE